MTVSLSRVANPGDRLTIFREDGTTLEGDFHKITPKGHVVLWQLTGDDPERKSSYSSVTHIPQPGETARIQIPAGGYEIVKKGSK